jgi:uncharacterized protein (UPF0548 family)
MVERPSEERLDSFLRSRREKALTYDEVGVSRRETAGGFVVDASRVKLGEGEEVFGRAVAALREWRMFDLGWASVFPREAPVEVGTDVAVVAEVFGLWSVNPCRIVYVVDEKRRFGFAYGTLPGHAAHGEELFSVGISDDGSVHYDIRAFSRPGALMRLGYPVARRFQRRFARDSLRAMSGAVSRRSC